MRTRATLLCAAAGLLTACVDTSLDPEPSPTPAAMPFGEGGAGQGLPPMESASRTPGASLPQRPVPAPPPVSTTNDLMFGSDGTNYRRIGNTTIGTGGQTYRPAAGGTIGSDGTYYRNIGATTVGSDGSRCRRVANSLIC